MRGSKWVMPRETRSSRSSEGQLVGKDQGCASRQLENMLLRGVRAQPEQQHSACLAACYSDLLITRKQGPLSGFFLYS